MLALNGSAKFNGNVLQLTDGQMSGSAFSLSRLNITSFTTQFDVQLPNPNAGGFTFTITGPTTTPVSIAINLHSTHVFRVGMIYDGKTLKVTITDTVSNASTSQSYAMNIPGAVGESDAYIGFTASTAGATPNVLDWAFTPGVASAPSTPTGFSVASASATEAALTWSGGASTTSYVIERKTGAGAFVPIAQVLNAASFLDTGLIVGGQYTYRVLATNPAGSSGATLETSVTLPMPPSPATDVKATRVTATEVDLSWKNNATNAQGYRIFREFQTSSMTILVATLPPGSTSYQDSGLTPNTFYQYHVEAYNSAGYSGDGKLQLTTLPAGPAPAPPTGLTALGGIGQVALNWLEAPDANSYNIYRLTKSNGEGGLPIQTGVTTTFFTDTGLAAGVTYYYEITSVGTGGQGARSAQVSGTTLEPPAAFASGFANDGSLLAQSASGSVAGPLVRSDGPTTADVPAFLKAAADISALSTNAVTSPSDSQSSTENDDIVGSPSGFVAFTTATDWQPAMQDILDWAFVSLPAAL